MPNIGQFQDPEEYSALKTEQGIRPFDQNMSHDVKNRPENLEGGNPADEIKILSSGFQGHQT